MSVFKHTFDLSVRDTDKNNEITNKAILEALEDAGGFHSDSVGYGISNIKDTNLTWVILYWKVRIFNRIHLGEPFTVSTWSSGSTKVHTFRDFEIYDNQNNLAGIATSKWIILDATTMKIAKFTPEMINSYSPENKRVFNGEEEIGKLSEPQEKLSFINCTIQRKDIDINGHMHNTNYLDLAYEALPEDIYKNSMFNNFEIMYKKEIKLGETVKCYYSRDNNIHYVTIKSSDDSLLHAIIKLS